MVQKNQPEATLLNVNDEEFFENPDSGTVRAAITSLPADSFAILGRGEHDYVQTYHDMDGTFALEYRAGSASEHYAATDERLADRDVCAAFEAYLTGSTGWQSSWKWEKVEFDDDFEGDLTADNAYLLNGEEYRKVAVGDEQYAVVTKNGKCIDCNAKVGHYHYDTCELEECPRCHLRLIECDCE